MRLPPDAFWRMSLPEWRAMMAGVTRGRAQPLARKDLDALMKDYPDG